MEPIISPWTIYLFGVLSKINAVSTFVAAFAFVVFIITCMMYYVEGKKFDYKIKSILAVLVISAVLAILIPGEKTLLAMLTLSFITPDNISIAEDHIIELVSKIMDTVSVVKK